MFGLKSRDIYYGQTIKSPPLLENVCWKFFPLSTFLITTKFFRWSQEIKLKFGTTVEPVLPTDERRRGPSCSRVSTPGAGAGSNTLFARVSAFGRGGGSRCFRISSTGTVGASHLIANGSIGGTGDFRNKYTLKVPFL